MRDSLAILLFSIPSRLYATATLCFVLPRNGGIPITEMARADSPTFQTLTEEDKRCETGRCYSVVYQRLTRTRITRLNSEKGYRAPQETYPAIYEKSKGDD